VAAADAAAVEANNLFFSFSLIFHNLTFLNLVLFHIGNDY